MTHRALLLYTLSGPVLLASCELPGTPPDAAVADAAVPREPLRRFDFDGDGYPDAVVGDPRYDADRGALWLVRGSPTGEPTPRLLLRGEPLERLGTYPLYVPDRDGDGRLEVGSLSASGVVRWVTSGGSEGSFATSVEIRDDGPGWRAVVVEMGDERALGLVIRDLCGHPDRPCTTAELVPSGRALTQGSPYADVEGIARRQLLVVERDGDDARLRAGAWSVTLPGVTDVTTIHVAGDVDADGREDFVAVSPVSAWLVRPRAEGGVLSEHRRYLMPLRSDLDGDGTMELADGPLVLTGSPEGPRASSIPRPPFSNEERFSSLGPPPDGLPASTTRTQQVMIRDGRLVAWVGEAPGDRSGGERIELATLFPDALPRAARHGWGDMPGMADLDGDGDEEFRVVGSSGSSRNPLRAETPPIAGDIDGDGRIDALLGGRGHWRVVAGPEGFAADPAAPATELVSVAAEYVEPAGDLDGDGLDDLLGSAVCAGTCEPERAHVWLGRDLSRGLGEPALTLDGHFISIGDVNDDGRDDVMGEGPSFHFGQALAGLEPTPAIVLPGVGGIMRGGVLIDAARTTPTSIAISRVSTEGLQPLGEPLEVLSTEQASWIPIHDDLPLLYLPWGHADGALLVRLGRDGLHRTLVVRVTLPSERDVFAPRRW